MPLVLLDRVRETTAVTGTNDAILLGAVTGFQSFAVIGNGNTCYYTIADQSGGSWEVGIGTYSTTGPTLQRTTILSSSNSGSKVSFSSGTKDVFVTYPSSRAVYVDGTTITPGTAATLPTTSGGTGLSSYTAGDLPYYATGTALSKLTIGSAGQILTSSGTAPQWSTLSGVAVTTFSAGTTGFTPNSATSGAITLAGTLNVANGGTGTSTAFTTGSVVFAGASGVYSQNNANFFWDNTNARLGIGTNAPSYPLDIRQTPGTNIGTSIALVNNSTGGPAKFVFGVGGSLTVGISAEGSGGSPANGMNLQVNGLATNAISITSTGNVGIGTANPGAPLAFSDSDALKIQFNSNSGNVYGISKLNTGGSGFGDGEYRFTAGSSSAGTFTFSSGGSERVRISSTGAVGIGLSNPTIRLEVVGASNVAASFIKVQGALPNNNDNAGLYVLHQGTEGTGFRVRTDNAVTGSQFAHVLVNNASASTGAFQVSQFGTGFIAEFDKSGTSALRVANTGNVGITNTAPRRNLEVSGTIAAPTALATAITTSANGTVIISDSGGGTVGSVIGTALNGSSYDTYIQARNMGAASTAYNLLLQPLGGNVGIGTSSPAVRLEVAGNVRLSAAGAVPAGLDIGLNGGNGVTNISCRDSSSNWRPLYVEADTTIFFTGSGVTERMRITSAGEICVGTSTALATASGRGNITINGSSSAILAFGSGGTLRGYLFQDSTTMYLVNSSSGSMNFEVNGSERMRINSSGRLLLGTTSDATDNPIFRATGGSNEIAVGSGDGARWQSTGADNFEFHTFTNTPNPNFVIGYGNGSGGVDTSKERVTVNAGTWSFQNSNLSISGSLSKGSGSFKIDHPLPTKTDTHFLVHSFIEAPQADLIYRGKVQLKNGKATVNIDTAARMSEGTFVLLCRDVQCFTSNESDWDAVRGFVSGNILTIECQNTSSTATISWMVIGERQDPHMYETSWTDNDGRVIVEPEKTIVDEKNIIFSGVIENA